jgi:3-oxoacyl-[acyl-carrier protein] reductase
MDLRLAGRAAFVAASSRGMGRAIAERFAAEGADVAMCARNGEVLREAAEAVRAHGVRVVAETADVSDAYDVATVVDYAANALGRLDALVVNAGGPDPGRFEDLDDQAWERAFQLTVMSAVRLVRAALPHLRRSDAASVLFLSSFSVRQPIPGLILSNSLRLAVSGLAKTLASELAPRVRVNVLLPGHIRTDRAVALARASAQPGQDVEEVLAARAEAIPLRRLGDPDEVARLAVFLCSPAASYVTGATVACDGGIIQAP